jgi:anti-anti-sigma regulatory factor
VRQQLIVDGRGISSFSSATLSAFLAASAFVDGLLGIHFIGSFVVRYLSFSSAILTSTRLP